MRGLFGAFAENWLEATGEVLVGDEYLPELERDDGGGPMHGRALERRRRRHRTSRRSTTSRSPRRSESIDLTAAYFVPRPAFTEALADGRASAACARACSCRGRDRQAAGPDRRPRAYAALLDAGVEVYEYQPTMLHAKSLSVDGVWSSVGSVNFDNRSFQLHDEATLCVTSSAFARALHGAVRARPRGLGALRRRSAGAGAARSARAAEASLRLARREL